MRQLPIVSLRRLPVLALLLWWLSLLPGAVLAQTGIPEATVRLTAGEREVALWPAWRQLSDPAHSLTIDQALARRGVFTVPQVPYANLGVRPDTVWLRTQISTAADAPAGWWFTIDFFPLDEVEVFLVQQGRVVQRAYLSQLLAFKDKAAPTHHHAARLALQPGQSYELVLRVRKYAPLAMLMPASLLQTDALLAKEASFQFWQSLMFGLGLCLTVYALVAAALNRERLYLWFALFAASHTLSWFSYFGLASQHFWPGHGGLNSNVSLLFALMLPLSGFLFVDRALDLPHGHPRLSKGLRIISGLLAILALMFIAGLVGESVVGPVIGLVGTWPFLLILPLALRRGLRRDRLALWVLIGWVPHAVALAIGAGLHQGHVPWSEWDNIVPQLGAAIDLLAWAMVGSLRTKDMRRDAALHREERDRLLVAVQTDALTGLANRRGLEHGLRGMLAKAGQGQMLALYVIDLDGFKPINDVHGHDAGDEALVMVAQRLKQAVRAGDLVCRIGGDEFVIVAAGLADEQQARLVADKLLACSAKPFVLSQASCHLGMTIGYAVAPLDATDPDSLLKQADAAMYRGKQAGKQQARRAE
ncbi:GGDEF domain-containing protein [Aquabacterium soli]|uniref:GGDEF domain-containing protein n=1 Tax=Aquabacterium soli TaxID=2493092 RepID=A0A426VC09_9BURK|nr:GGDEF domain-containing protein [Aquabacterium soli]